MFLGNFIYKIDDKNRIFIPATFRKSISEVTLTYIDESTLILMDSKEWTPEVILSEANLPHLKLKSLIHYITYNSITLKIDSQGRIVIPSNIMSKLSFKEALILGKKDYFIIMNNNKYEEELNKINEEWATFLQTVEGQNYKRTLIFKKN